MVLQTHYKNLPKLLIGMGTLSELRREMIFYKSQYVLIIAEPVFERTDVLQAIKSYITPYVNNVRIHYVTEVKQNLQEREVFTTTLQFNKYDTIIGLGNSDLLNYAKIMAQILSHRKDAKPTINVTSCKATLSLILIPTTPTSGIEAAKKTYTYHQHVKVIQTHKQMCPATIIYDPLIPIKSSPYEMISSSIVTLSEAIEAKYFAHNNTRFPTAAIKLIMNYIIRATYNKDDEEAHEALLKAGMVLGLAHVRRNKCSLIDCMTIPIICQVDVPYPVALSVMLPYVIEMYRDVNEKRANKIADAFDYQSSNIDSLHSYIARRLTNMIKTLGFPLHLRSLGVKKEDLTTLAFNSYTLWAKNNRDEPKWDELTFEKIYNKAYAGKTESPFNN